MIRLGVLVFVVFAGVCLWWASQMTGLSTAEVVLLGGIAVLLFGRRLPDLLRWFCGNRPRAV